tara:strand:- start:3257 stop:4501 length:1245 start_codon:yes stop_codon:yes gene_type:complete
MAEIVKVFKNTGGTPIVPANMDTAIDYTLHTTSSSENVVIKDVNFKISGNGATRCDPVLELNGTKVRGATGGSLNLDSNIIMGPSSTLKTKFDPTAGTQPATFFKGMFFTEGSSGIQFLEGNGATAASIAPVKITTSSNPCDDAVAAKWGGTHYYYKTYNNTIYEYTEASAASNNNTASWTHGSTGYSITSDGTYLYRGGSGTTTNIWRTKLSDKSTSTLTTTSNYRGPGANQGGAFNFYRDPATGTGYIFTKYDGPEQNLYRINLTTLAVTTYSSGNYYTGTYSDGGFITTNTSGVPYVVEAGDAYWWYHNINTGAITRGSGGGTSTSTEYAQGGAEIAPGIGIIFGEENDRATLINMNPATPTMSTDTGSHPYTTDYGYGNRFGFAGYLESTANPTFKDFEYSAYVSGIEIT